MQFEIDEIPENTGVYFLLDDKEAIIDIGKSVNIRKRISDHFNNGTIKVFKKIKDEDRKPKKKLFTHDLIQMHIDDIKHIIYDKQQKKKRKIKKNTKTIKYIITENEEEALTLEGCLISSFRPPLNRAVWRYPFIEVTLGEEVPRIVTCYQNLHEDSYIYGPFNFAANIDLAMDGFLTVIPICNSLSTTEIGGRYPVSCIRHQLNRCLSPCKRKNIDMKQYKHFVKYFIFQLENNGKDVIKKLQRLMEVEIERENFEGAAIIRDRIQAIEKLFEAKAMPTILKKYYNEIKEIIGRKYNYQNIIENILEYNGS